MKIERITQRFVVFVGCPFRSIDHPDHISSHRQMWNTWKHWFQRVSESKWNRAKTTINHQKLLKKSLQTSLIIEAQFLKDKGRPYLRSVPGFWVYSYLSTNIETDAVGTLRNRVSMI